MVRATFKKAFNITSDDDILRHDTVAQERLAAHAEGVLPGPNHDALQFDFFGNEHAIWNKKVFDILEKQVMLMKEEPQYMHIPTVSHAYLRTLIIGKYKRLRQKWRDALPKTNYMGVTESMEEAQARLYEKADEEGRRKRRDRRRMAVSLQSFERRLADKRII